MLYGISSALFLNCDNVYQSPFLQKVFPCVTFFDITLEVFTVIMTSVLFKLIKIFHTVLSRKPSWPCAVTESVPNSNLVRAAIFFSFLFFSTFPLVYFFTTVIIIINV